MNFNDLKKQQRRELADYWLGRGKRETELNNEQEDALKHISITGPQGQEYIERIFREQNEAFISHEQDELDKLLFAQQCERQNFFEKEVKRDSLVYLMNRISEKDRGR